MTTLTYTVPTAGSTLNSIADPEIQSAFNAILTWANGNIDTNNLSATAGITAAQLAAALAQSASVNQGAQTVKGAANIATSQTTTSATYTTLATPDQVTIVLPTNGLIAVWYQATLNGTGFATIFLGSNQVQLAGLNAPAVQAASFNTSGVDSPISTGPVGLITPATPGAGYSGDVTTGQIVGTPVTSGSPNGGPCYIFAAAGTYTVSIQFRASVGTVTVKNRKLWVQALSFA